MEKFHFTSPTGNVRYHLLVPKILKSKQGFIRKIIRKSFILLSTGSFRVVVWKRWQNEVFYIYYKVCYWYYHMVFHLHPVVLVVQAYCGLLISNCIGFLPAVHLIIKLLFSIFCRWKHEFSSEFHVLCNYKQQHVKPSCWKSGRYRIIKITTELISLQWILSY